MVDFGGWNMPVQYSGIVEEHETVRNAVGLFDISHMGQFFASGPGATAWLETIFTNRVEKLDVGQCQYTFMLNEKGGVIDDLILYRCEPELYLMVVNASKIEEDWAWLQGHLAEGVTLENQSDAYAGLAVQGPAAPGLFAKVFGPEVELPDHNHIARFQDGQAAVYVARTGYTGEDGFELFPPAPHAVTLWRKLLEEGTSHGVKPCGLGARDTLRLEKCLPLNGADLSPDHTPLEAGLPIFVDMTKETFIGKPALAQQKENGLPSRLAAFVMEKSGPPPRPHYKILKNGAEIGEITSGTLSPSLKKGIGMAYLPTELARLDETVEIEIRNRTFPARIVRKPFYKKS